MLDFFRGCFSDWKRREDPTSVCGFERASCLFLHSCEKKKKSNERTDPFSFFSSPTQSFLPLYFSQAALFKKQKNSTLTQCVALKVIIKHGNLS